MLEKDLQNAVIDLARLTGWMVHHTRPARTKDGGWVTPIQGDKGFPDLVLAHPERGVLFVELKSAKGRLSDDQIRWGECLVSGGVESSFVWRPCDWDDGTIEMVLKSGLSNL